jgi:menaquinone-dependent protoporphyrinogen oxidase
VPNALIVYATTHGHTARVAARLASAFGRAGVAAHRYDVRAIPAAVAARDYDAVVVAASVHDGRHQREIVDWVSEHHMSLSLRPTAFVSVSLSAADDAPEARADARRCVDRFVEDTDWTPDMTLCVAGAMRHSDWDALERFGRTFAATVLHAREPV